MTIAVSRSGLANRIGDLEEDVKVVGAVDDGGVDVLVGQGEKGLAQEETVKGVMAPGRMIPAYVSSRLRRST